VGKSLLLTETTVGLDVVSNLRLSCNSSIYRSATLNQCTKPPPNLHVVIVKTIYMTSRIDDLQLLIIWGYINVLMKSRRYECMKHKKSEQLRNKLAHYKNSDPKHI